MNIAPKIKALITQLEHTDICSEEELHSIVKNLNINIADISDYINFRHPLNESYGRKVIYESNRLEIVTMTWNVGDYTSIHDHGQAQWGLVYSFGNIQNTTFELIDNKLKVKHEELLKTGEITVLDNSAIHQMGNTKFRPTVSLHIYYSNHAQKGVTAEARNFDLIEKKVYKANGGAFLLLPEENIVAEEKCPDYDQELYEKQFAIRRNFTDKCYPTKVQTNINLAQKKYYEQR